MGFQKMDLWEERVRWEGNRLGIEWKRQWLVMIIRWRAVTLFCLKLETAARYYRMLQNQIPFYNLRESSFDLGERNSPIIVKCNNHFKLNCRNAIKQSKINLPLFPKIQISNRPLLQRGVNSQRSPKIKFIKEIQKEIKTLENRQKVRSLIKNFSRQENRNEDKENLCKIKSFSKLKIHLEPLEEEKGESVHQASNSLKIQRKPSEYLPKCKVGKVRYRARETTTRNFWEEINVSEILIKDENQEETGTLLNIEAEMNRNQ